MTIGETGVDVELTHYDMNIQTGEFEENKDKGKILLCGFDRMRNASYISKYIGSDSGSYLHQWWDEPPWSTEEMSTDILLKRLNTINNDKKRKTFKWMVRI